jgi:hypothetical protein
VESQEEFEASVLQVFVGLDSEAEQPQLSHAHSPAANRVVTTAATAKKLLLYVFDEVTFVISILLVCACKKL